MADEEAISPRDESETRMDCLAAATVLNQLREIPKEDAADVIADAALYEHYVTMGQSVAVYCDNRLAFTIRG